MRSPMLIRMLPRFGRHFALAPIAAVSMLVLSVILAGCQFLPGASPSVREQILRELAANRVRWESKGIRDYTISIERTCFCPESKPYDVTVVGGVITAVTQDGKPVQPNDVRDLPKTVDELFALPAALAPTAGVKLGYDEQFGLPLLIIVDPIPNAIDDEYEIHVTNFRLAS